MCDSTLGLASVGDTVLSSDISNASTTPEQTKTAVLGELKATQSAAADAATNIADAPAPGFDRGEELKAGYATMFGAASSLLETEIPPFESTTFATNAEIQAAVDGIGSKLDQTLNLFDELSEIEDQLTTADKAAIVAAAPSCANFLR